MNLLKKVASIYTVFLLFLFMFLSANAARMPFEDLPEAERPTRVVRYPYAVKTNVEVPSSFSLTGSIYETEITTDPVYRDVKVTFNPESLLADIDQPAGFSVAVAVYMPAFFEHLANGGTTQSFLRATGTAFFSIAASMEESVYVIGTKPRQIIGKRVLTPLITPTQFFDRLEQAIREVRTQGYRALCQRNPTIMLFMRDILQGDRLDSVTYENLGTLMQFLVRSGLGYFEKAEKEYEIIFRRGKFRLMVAATHKPEDLRKVMNDFMRRSFSQEMLSDFESLTSFQLRRAASSSAETASVSVEQKKQEHQPRLTREVEEEATRQLALEARRLKSIVDIQRVARGYLGRKYVSQVKEQDEAASQRQIEEEQRLAVEQACQRQFDLEKRQQYLMREAESQRTESAVVGSSSRPGFTNDRRVSSTSKKEWCNLL